MRPWRLVCLIQSQVDVRAQAHTPVQHRLGQAVAQCGVDQQLDGLEFAPDGDALQRQFIPPLLEHRLDHVSQIDFFVRLAHPSALEANDLLRMHGTVLEALRRGGQHLALGRAEAAPLYQHLQSAQ